MLPSWFFIRFFRSRKPGSRRYKANNYTADMLQRNCQLLSMPKATYLHIFCLKLETIVEWPQGAILIPINRTSNEVVKRNGMLNTCHNKNFITTMRFIIIQKPRNQSRNVLWYVTSVTWLFLCVQKQKFFLPLPCKQSTKSPIKLGSACVRMTM